MRMRCVVFCPAESVKTNMRLLLVLLAISALQAVAAASCTRAPPNILFMMADQMRADALGCAGNAAISTPNLDRLAGEGVRFSNAFSSTPSCTPARAAILTGLSPWYHGMLGYGEVADRYPYELPRALSSAGYFTCSIGKDHFGWNSTTNEGVPHGYDKTNIYDGLPGEVDDYDHWFAKADPGADPMATGLEYNDYRGRAYVLDEYYHPTAYVGRAAIQFLKTYNQTTRPFFLKVSFHRPHSPYDPPKAWMDQYSPNNMPDPYVGANWDSRYAVNYNTTPSPGIWCGNISLDTLRVSRQAYYANVGFIDSWVGEILTVLQEQGLAENTFVLFTADHGDMLGDHYHFRKTYPYFGSAHIPMMFKWPPSFNESSSLPGTAMISEELRGSVRNEVVELRDLFPTFLNVAGVPVAHTLNGSSLLNLLHATSHAQCSKKGATLEEKVYYKQTKSSISCICHPFRQIHCTILYNALVYGHKTL